jgi:hypothetical protein
MSRYPMCASEVSQKTDNFISYVKKHNKNGFAISQ